MGVAIPVHQTQTTCHCRPTVVQPAGTVLSLSQLADNHGMIFARKSSNRQNCAKDMRILIEVFPPISTSKWALKSRPSSSTNFHHFLIIYCRNFQPIGVYCSLNLGVSGLIQDEESLTVLYKNNQIGDIVDVVVS